MKKLTLEDIKPLAEYEQVRKDFRRRIIEHKKDRRIPLGDSITLVFEDRQTLIFQIQEMMRVEHIYDPEKIQTEVETYNALIPEAGELSATLFIEITDLKDVRETLDRFMGIDQGNVLCLQLGADRIDAVFETGHSKEDKLSAVHYLRFHLTPRQQEDLENPAVPAKLLMRHPHYQAEAPLPEAVRKSLARDLKNP